MSIKEIKRKYSLGDIDKQRYIDLSAISHQNLFDYCELLRTVDLSKIEISELGLVCTTKYDELKFFCKTLDKRVAPIEILNFSEYEQAETEMLKSIFSNQPDGSVFFDIGANIGWYSLLVAKSNPKTNVYSFELVSNVYNQLVSNIKLNNLENIKCYNFGFFDEEKTVKFNYDKNFTGKTSLIYDSDISIHYEISEVKTIDDYFSSSEITRLDVIKCDVEGAEFLVYKGGRDTIKKFKPIIFSEMLRKWSKKFNYHPNDVIVFFNELDYDCFGIGNSKLRLINSVDTETKETNYIFVPKNKTNFLSKFL